MVKCVTPMGETCPENSRWVEGVTAGGCCGGCVQFLQGKEASASICDELKAVLDARAHWPLCLATGGRVFVAGIFIPVGNHYFQDLASTLQFVAQVCDRLWLVPATDRAFLCLRAIF